VVFVVSFMWASEEYCREGMLDVSDNLYIQRMRIYLSTLTGINIYITEFEITIMICDI
jgi:hypothetical protein